MTSTVSYIPLNPDYRQSANYLYFIPTSQSYRSLGCFLLDHENCFERLNLLLERLPLEDVAVKAECRKLGKEFFSKCFSKLEMSTSNAPKDSSDDSFCALRSMQPICSNLDSEEKRRFVSLAWDGIGNGSWRWLTARLLWWGQSSKLTEGCCSFNYDPFRFGYLD
jgi:hypothetical protein